MHEKPTYEDLERRILELEKAESDRKGGILDQPKSAQPMSLPSSNSKPITFENLFSIQDIQCLQDDFARATGVASIITRTDGTPITKPSSFCRLCRDFILETEKGLSNCVKSYAAIGRLSIDSPTIQPCMSGGLLSAAAAISIEDRHIASWIICQVRDDSQSEEDIRKYAREIGEDETAMVEAFAEVPSMSKAQFGRIAKLLFTLSNQLSAAAYLNVQLTQLIRQNEQATEDLKEQETYLRNLVRTIPDLVGLKSPDGVYFACNARVENLFGSQESEIKGKTDYDLLDREMADFFRQKDMEAIEKRGPVINEEEVVFAVDGHREILEAIRTPMFRSDGSLAGVLGIGRDITQRKRIEMKLLESEERLRLTLENTQIGIWDWDVKNEKWYASPTYYSMLGYEPDAGLGNLSQWLDRVHPDDRELVTNKIQSVLMNGLLEYQYEARVRHADGTYRWCYSRGSIINHDKDGKAIRVLGIRMDITNRKLAEIQRQEAQQRFADIVEFLPDATFVIDQDKKIIAWNHACEVMTGVTKDALLGQGDYAYAVPFYGERHPILIDLLDSSSPESEAIFNYVQRQNGKIYAEGYVPGLKNGRGVHLWAVASPLYDSDGRRSGAIETIRDISDFKIMEEALRASELQYRELVMLANSIILRWSNDGRIKFLNEFGQRFFGYKETEILGRELVETIVPADESAGRKLGQLIEEIRKDPLKFERNINENIRRNGERVWIDWTNKAIFDEKGQIKEILSIGSDITERKQAEEQIHQLNDELRQQAQILEQRVEERTAELVVARDQAETANRVKSAFLANMSHELRTPLNSIIGFTGILLQELAGPLNAEQEKQLGMVQSSSRHLLALINDVLDISKIEAGQLELSSSSFDLRKSVERVVAFVSPLAAKKGIDLRLVIADDIATVSTDQRRLEQIILNLLNNALKFTEKGHVILCCRTEDDGYLISVEDTGIGIQSEELSSLFRPFHQIDTGLSRKHEGTGLGLSICKKLIDLMGGTINVQSRPGLGSTFTLRFPQQAKKGEPS